MKNNPMQSRIPPTAAAIEFRAAAHAWPAIPDPGAVDDASRNDISDGVDFVGSRGLRDQTVMRFDSGDRGESAILTAVAACAAAFRARRAPE
jgi:hypothetical protein